MDKTQLATIAITALVSVTIKEVITWLWASVKATATASTTKAKLRAIFTKTNLAVAWDIFAILVYVTLVVQFGMGSGAPTRLDILIMAGGIIFSLVMVIVLLVDIAKAVIAKQDNAKNG